MNSQPSLLETIFGPNWRTSLSGLSTTIAAIAAALAILPSDTWQSPKVWIPAVLGIIAKTIKDFNTKDVQTSGNGTIDAPHQVSNGDGTSKTLPVQLIAILLLPALMFCIPGCAQIEAAQSNPKVVAAEKAAGTIALQFLLSAAQTEANGGKFDSTWAIGTGLNSLANVVPTLTNDQASQVIVNTAQAFSADDSTKPLAQKLAAAYVQANPQTPAEKTATIVALATGTMNGATNAAAAQP